MVRIDHDRAVGSVHRSFGRESRSVSEARARSRRNGRVSSGVAPPAGAEFERGSELQPLPARPVCRCGRLRVWNPWTPYSASLPNGSRMHSLSCWAAACSAPRDQLRLARKAGGVA